MIRGRMTRRLLVVVAGFGVAGAAGVAAAQTPETIEVFAAGSLRGVVGELAETAPSLGVEIKSTFGGSGLLRERIEKGESPDLFLSADVGNPQKLAAQGRGVLPPIAFARNRICVVSRRSAGVTASNLIDRMLAKGVRLKTSMPVADPSGDYAWAILDRIESSRKGAGAALKEKAQASMTLTGTPSTPGQSPAAALFATKQIDMSITYCSGAASLEKELPELTSLVVPPQLDPHPLYGLIVLSSKPQAQKLALYVLSEKGQAIIQHQGLVPVGALEASHP